MPFLAVAVEVVVAIAVVAIAAAVMISTVSIAVSDCAGTVCWWHQVWWSWTASHGMIAAKHGNALAVLGAAEGHHMLADVVRNDFAERTLVIDQDPLDEIVAKLVGCD